MLYHMTSQDKIFHTEASIPASPLGSMRGEDVQMAHKIGYWLEDAKTTLRQSVKIRVGDTDISGKEGEVINVPLWAGAILEENGMAAVDTPDVVTELKQVTVKEQMVGKYQLASLDEKFYIRLQSQMRKLKPRDRDGVESMMMELFRMRRGKIVQLADSTRLTAEIKSRISIEERAFFDAINREGEMLKCRVGSNE